MTDNAYLPLVEAMRALAGDLLACMHDALRGEMDEARYVRVFGAKEGMVPQLQKLCGLVEDMRALDAQCRPAQPVAGQDVDLYEQRLIAHYLQEYRQRALANADDGSLA